MLKCERGCTSMHVFTSFLTDPWVTADACEQRVQDGVVVMAMKQDEAQEGFEEGRFGDVAQEEVQVGRAGNHLIDRRLRSSQQGADGETNYPTILVKSLNSTDLQGLGNTINIHTRCEFISIRVRHFSCYAFFYCSANFISSFCSSFTLCWNFLCGCLLHWSQAKCFLFFSFFKFNTCSDLRTHTILLMIPCLNFAMIAMSANDYWNFIHNL